MAVRRAVVAGLLLTPLVLSGCGSETEAYCDELRDQQSTLDRLARGSQRPSDDLFTDSLQVFRTLREKAPSDIRDEWDTYVFAWQDVADAFDAAGIGPADYQQADPPPGVSDQQLEAIEDAAAELRSPRVVDAGTGIEQHARDVCDVDLGL
jgi:hypothetical protein